MTSFEEVSVNHAWPKFRARFLFRQRRERAHQDDIQLTASQAYGVISQSKYNELSDTRATAALAGTESFLHVEENDFVISLRAFEGGIERAREKGCISPAYTVMRPSAKVEPTFFQYLLKSSAFIQALQTAVTGIRDGKSVRYEQFSDLVLPTPDVDTQKNIAGFLDRETARIDQLIEKKRLFVIGTARRIEALVDQALSDANVPRIRFEHLTQRVLRPVTLSEHDALVRLGLYNRGRGLFKKPAADEEGMGDSEFFFVEAGDLIISGQFAWEGAVALASGEEEGCVVSHRYPVYRGKSGVSTSYLLGLLRSNYGHFVLNEASRGSAGRNRPLNVRRLEKEKIPIPGPKLQNAIEQAVDFERRLKGKTEQSIARLEEFRAALITAAVTGQIDVATWNKRGHADRQFDAVQQEIMS